jgi:hypothetical protein
MSSKFSAGDFVQSVLLGLGITVVLLLIGVGVSIGIGIPGVSLTQAEGTRVAVIEDTPIPPTATPTEIPCTAEEWWAANGATFDSLYTQLRSVSVGNERLANQTQTDLANWQAALDQTSAPPCAATARQVVDAASSTANAYLDSFLTVSTEQQRAAGLITVMDALLLVTDELEKVEVTPAEAWFSDVRTFTRAECPVQRWFLSQIYSRDYGLYLGRAGSNVQELSNAEQQTLAQTMRTLSTSLQVERTNYPACVETATNHLITYFSAVANQLNSLLNNQDAQANQAMIDGSNALRDFFAELLRLDPAFVAPRGIS